jgi:hypothetical protein
MASIMTVHENGEQTFTVYDAAEENERDRGKVASRMVRFHPTCLSNVRLRRLIEYAIFCIVLISANIGLDPSHVFL